MYNGGYVRLYTCTLVYAQRHKGIPHAAWLFISMLTEPLIYGTNCQLSNHVFINRWNVCFVHDGQAPAFGIGYNSMALYYILRSISELIAINFIDNANISDELCQLIQGTWSQKRI